MKESNLIKFLYKTLIGRLILKGLVRPSVSKRYAKFFSSSASAGIIRRFVRKNGIDLEMYRIPKGGYTSFNDFFTREKKEIAVSESGFVCPCDGLLTISDINEDSVFYIKHTSYSVGDLLQDEELAKKYMGGTAYVFRLTPAHYHRYLFCTDGVVSGKKRIEGVLHSVQPVCHRTTKVFVQNSREYIIIDSPQFGPVIQMEIGALLVGRISNHEISVGDSVAKGTEKGYFEYGGSSIVVLTEKNNELPETLTYRVTVGDEIPVNVGEALL